jgi:hypothetical protein
LAAVILFLIFVPARSFLFSANDFRICLKRTS